MKKAIIGAGGFAREVAACLKEKIVFFVEDEFYDPKNSSCLPLSCFNSSEYEVVVAIADVNVRKRIVESLPGNTKYFKYVHPSAQIMDVNNVIGEGSIICANCTITTNVKLGKHTHLNPMVSIGHDTVAGDYFTALPGARISGNCLISEMTTMGAGSSIREKTKILSKNVFIGMQAAVVKDIVEPGIYVGVPCRKLVKQ